MAKRKSKTQKHVQDTVLVGTASLLGVGPGGLKAGATLVGVTGKHGPKSVRAKKYKKDKRFRNLYN